MTVVQQIVYTEHPERWWALAEALGFAAPYPPTPEWGEFHGDGVLAVHRAIPDKTADLHLLVEDLDAAADALAGFDIERTEMAGVGEMLILGSDIAVSVGSAPRAQGAAVQPVWFADDLAEPRAILEALGFRADIAADAGGWVELRGSGGLVGLHRVDRARHPVAGIGPSFQVEDVDAVLSRLQDAGFEASIVDEAYARTIHVSGPDGDVCIDGAQSDLYGYHREP